jgi:hypothetical protein
MTKLKLEPNLRRGLPHIVNTLEKVLELIFIIFEEGNCIQEVSENESIVLREIPDTKVEFGCQQNSSFTK